MRYRYNHYCDISFSDGVWQSNSLMEANLRKCVTDNISIQYTVDENLYEIK